MIDKGTYKRAYKYMREEMESLVVADCFTPFDLAAGCTSYLQLDKPVSQWLIDLAETFIHKHHG